MLIKDIQDCETLIAGDKSHLKELLSPTRDDISTGYSIAHASVEPGSETIPHQLTSSEVFYVFQGTGSIRIDDEIADLQAGQLVYIPPNSIQSIRNTGDVDLKFLCIVDPPWLAENETIIQ